MKQKEFERIYQEYANTIYKVAISYMKSPASAEDITADVFVKLLDKSPKFENSQHEKAWLLRVTINMCKNQLSHWSQKNLDIAAQTHLETTGIPDETSIWDEVLALPEKYKDVILLHYCEGYKTGEIAEILERNESTIRGHLVEARNLLKGVLENES